MVKIPSALRLRPQQKNFDSQLNAHAWCVFMEK